MQYYLLTEGDKKSSEHHVLIGESSFGVFWADQGLKALFKIVEQAPDLLPSVRIVTDLGTDLNLAQFLEELDNFKIRYR